MSRGDVGGIWKSTRPDTRGDVMSETPIYTSRSTVRSIWQEYRIYEDRLEFDTHLGKLTVPFDHIERVEVSESEVRGLLRGDLHLTNFRPAVKIDWANFVEHVVVDKQEGTIRRLLFTPDDVPAFKKVLDEQLTRYRRERP
jgi:hypothetical protein